MLTSLAVLVPAVSNRLHPAAGPSAAPTAQPTAPPAAVLLPEELDKALQGVMVLVNDRTFGTAFQIDRTGVFLTASNLVDGSQHLRLVDNTGGSHAVRVVGYDATLGFAEIRSEVAGVPLTLGNSSLVQAGDSVVVLASQKVVNLRAATPAVITQVTNASFGIRADDLPGEYGGPVVGPGGTVLGLLTQHGVAVPIERVETRITAWQGQPGTLVRLASLPADLVLRGSEDTTAPVRGASLASITPRSAPRAQATVVSLQGSGFVPGGALMVRFLPVASPDGAFIGIGPAVANAGVVTVKVPGGQVAQEYVVEFTNGNGLASESHPAFTITP